jgi:pimeloyl-ACP methyl ester carboxylesterase
MPGADAAALAHMCELQRLTASAETAVALRRAADGLDVSDSIGSVRTPTLVLHARGDAVHPLSEGLEIAASIPGARFVELSTDNHVLLPSEDAFDAALAEIERFAAGAG